MDYFPLYYLLMAYLGALVIVATIMRNQAATERRCHDWNIIAITTWHLGAILFIIYLADLILI